MSDFSIEEIRESLEVISANLSQESIDSVQAEEQQSLANIESATAPAAVPMQNEWGSNTRIQPAASLSKIKSKTRSAKKAEITEEFHESLAGTMNYWATRKGYRGTF